MYLIPYATFSDNYHYAFSRKVFFLRDRAGQGVVGWGGQYHIFHCFQVSLEISGLVCKL